MNRSQSLVLAGALVLLTGALSWSEMRAQGLLARGVAVTMHVDDAVEGLVQGEQLVLCEGGGGEQENDGDGKSCAHRFAADTGQGDRVTR